jgi:hypothetical protein
MLKSNAIILHSGYAAIKIVSVFYIFQIFPVKCVHEVLFRTTYRRSISSASSEKQQSLGSKLGELSQISLILSIP